MTDVLVTGAAGFVGARLVAALEARGDTVIALTHADGDIADPATLADVPAAAHVFHLAARSFVPDSWRDPVGFHHANVVGTAAVLEYCHRHGSALTFTSTYLYGNPDALPVAESAPLRPTNPYALSKRLAEELCRFHAETTGLPVTVVRPFNIYGPGQRAEFLIPKILGQVRAGGPIAVENLSPKRDYLFIDDLIDALLRTTQGPAAYRVMNLGTGVSHSVGEVIEAIQATARTDFEVQSEGRERPNEIHEVRADIGLAQAELGWNPRTSLADGIEQCVIYSPNSK